jgi:hypothetical protein
MNIISIGGWFDLFAYIIVSYSFIVHIIITISHFWRSDDFLAYHLWGFSSKSPHSKQVGRARSEWFQLVDQHVLSVAKCCLLAWWMSWNSLNSLITVVCIVCMSNHWSLLFSLKVFELGVDWQHWCVWEWIHLNNLLHWVKTDVGLTGAGSSTDAYVPPPSGVTCWHILTLLEIMWLPHIKHIYIGYPSAHTFILLCTASSLNCGNSHSQLYRLRISLVVSGLTKLAVFVNVAEICL